jgi:PAS domain S-box-containing protein
MEGIRSDSDFYRCRISFEKSSLPVLWVDTSAKVLDANESACSSLGYKREELKGMHVYDFDIRWNKEEIISNALPRMRENKSMTFESVHQRKDGSRVPVEITCVLFNLEGKEIIFSFVKDITYLKRSRELARKRSEKLKNIIEHANEIFYVHDLNNILTYVSPQCEKIFGYTQEEMKINWMEFNTKNPQNKIGYESTMKAEKTGIRQPPYQLEVRHKSGKNIWIEIDESPLKDKAGKVIGMTGAVRDITKRKQTMNRLIIRHKLSQGLNSSSGLKEALRICLKHAIEISDMDCGGIYLKDPATGDFCLEVHQGLSEGFIAKVRVFPPESPSAKMIDEGKPIYSSYDNMESLTGPKLRHEDLRAIAGIPIKHKKEIIGSLNVSSRSIENPSPESRIALETIAADIGDALFRFRAEERLRQSEQRYRTLIENIPVGVYTAKLDPNSTYIYISPKARKILGVSSEYVKKNPDFWIKHAHPEDIPLIMAEIERTKRKHRHFSAEYRMYRKDGKMIWVHDEANVIEGKDGHESILQGFVEDITDRKESERTIKREKERAQNYFGVASAIMLVLEPDQRVSMINKKGCEIIGLPEREIIGKNWFENFIPEDFRKRAKSAFSEIMKGKIGSFEYGENPIITKSGIRLIEWRNSILRDENGVVCGTISSGFDVTEKRTAEEEIKLYFSDEEIMSY